jgi:hypothetical protein
LQSRGAKIIDIETERPTLLDVLERYESTDYTDYTDEERSSV